MDLSRTGLFKQEQEEVPVVDTRQAEPARMSLVERVGKLACSTSARPLEETGQGEDEPSQVCDDGYVRRSPVQPYRVSPNRRKRMWRYAVALLLVMVAAVLLFLAARGPFLTK